MMKYGCSIIALLFYSAALYGANAQNYQEEILTENVSNEGSANENEQQQKVLTAEELLKLQEDLANDDNIKSRLANTKDIEYLTKKGILISEDSFIDIENLEDEEDDDSLIKKKRSVLLEIDLLNWHNMNTVLYEGLKYAIDSDNVPNLDATKQHKRTSIFKMLNKKNKYQNLADTDEQTSEVVNLNESISNLKDALEKNKNLPIGDVQLKLSAIYEYLKSFGKHDKSLKDDVFYNFIRGMVKLYNVQIARTIANQIMQTNRLNIEDTVISATTPNVSIRDGYSDTALFTSKSSFGGNIDILKGDFGFGEAGISIGAKYTTKDIFYTIEQLLDSGEIGTMTKISWYFINKNLHNARKTRSDMQKKELELLKTFQSSVEFYLKLSNIIPNAVNIMWPSITRSTTQEASKSISGSLSAYVELKNAAGFSIETEATISKWSKSLEYMSLITKDCKPSPKMTVDDIIKILQKGDEEKEQNFEILQDVEMQINLLIGDIQHYLNILSAYNVKKTHELKNKKHEFEKIHQFSKHTKGRLGVFKYMMTMAVLARNSATTPSQIELFKKFYKLLEKLALMQNFSRKKSHRTARYSLNTKSNSQTVSGICELKIPGISGTNVSFTRSRIRDIPFQESNGDCMEFQVHVPSAVVGKLVTDHIKNKLLSSAQFDKNDDANLLDYKDPFEQSSKLIDKIQITGALGNIASGGLIKGTTGISTLYRKIEPDLIMPYPQIKGTRNEAENMEILPLPGKDLQEKQKSEWVNLYWIVTSSVEVNTSIIPLDVSLSQPIRKIGTDTLIYLTGRYNVCALGFNDEFSDAHAENNGKKTIKYTLSSNVGKLSIKDVSDKIHNGKINEISAFSPWEKVKAEQRVPLFEIFKKIGNNHKNLLHELQGMYTKIMHDIPEIDKDKCTQLFKNFLDECEKISNGRQTEMNNAIRLLEKIFWYNYLYNFKLSYEKAYSAQ